MAARVTCRCGWTRTYATPARAEANAARHVCKTVAGVRRATRRFRCARCGLEAVYENAGATEARAWFNRHSCRKREDAMVRAAQAAAREALVDRTPKPCLHKIAAHEHGTPACYVLDGCRCLPCSNANTARENERRRLKAYGRYNKYVPAGPVRAHIDDLRAAGMGLKTIAKRSGVSTGTLSKLVYGVYAPGPGGRGGRGELLRGPSRRVTRETADKIYALDPNWTGPLALADGAVLPAEESARVSRRLQALVALGWSMSELGRRLGITHVRNAMPIIKGDRRITVATARTADALFEALSMTLPPELTHRQRISTSRARTYAKAHGWVPPLALDDDLDPTDVVDGPDLDEAAIYRRTHGDRTVRLTPAEATELVRRWAAAGRPLADCERLTGIKPDRHYRIKDQEEAS